MRLVRVAAAAAAIASLAAPAHGNQGGVVVDPNSPSGREYAIPLDTARRDADPARGGSTGTNAKGGTTPLFGAGVTRPAAPPYVARVRPRAHVTRPVHRSLHHTSRQPRRERHTLEPPRSVRIAAANPGASGGGMSPLLVILGTGVFILLAGGLGGIALRRRSSGG